MISQGCFLLFFFVVAAAEGPNPPCQVCGCSTCPTTFEMANPDATFTVPEEYKAEFFNLATVPCGTIQSLGQSGQIPADVCTDNVRLFEDFRTTCGCPPVPGAAVPSSPPPVAVTTSTPVATTTITTKTPITTTVVATEGPTPSPSLSITKCEICSCAICADGQSVGNKDGVFTIPDDISDRFQGFVEVGCVDLEDFASNGVFKEINFICSDEFRMRDDFRSACGCVQVQVDAPIPILCPPKPPQESPIDMNTCDICGDGLKMSNRDAMFHVDTSTLGGLTEATVMGCGNLEDIAFFGDTDQEFTMALCDDSFRLDIDFRKTCGCPSIDDGQGNNEEKGGKDFKDVKKPKQGNRDKQKETMNTDDNLDPPTDDNDDKKDDTNVKPEKTKKMKDDVDDQPDGNDDDKEEQGDGNKVNKQAMKTGGMKLIRRKQF